MKKVTIAVRLLLAVIVVGVGIVAMSAVFPSHVFAAEVSVQTAQLLPPGSNTCAPLAASGFTPYVYDNALHAFEFTLQDSSYVAVIGTVGNTNIPLNQMRRQIDSTGALRIHADVATTQIRGSLPITVTLLSAKGPSQPVCVSVVVTTLLGSGSAPPTPAPAPSSGASSAPAPKPSTPAAAATKEKTKTGTSTAALAVTQNVMTALKDICSPKNAPTLWVILLVLYAAGVAAVVFGKPKMPAFMQSQESIAAAIVVPFLLLFGLWYFAESCRINAWAPAIATIIALAGLSVAFWEKPKSVQGVINLPSAKS